MPCDKAHVRRLISYFEGKARCDYDVILGKLFKHDYQFMVVSVVEY